MKKCVYAVCALLWAGCTASRSASDDSKDREQKETVQIDSLAPNPFIRHIYTADPSAHVWADGRLYVYASHDIDPPRGCDLMDQYHVFSTDDMVHWTDHGEILRASQVPWGRKEGGFMWAPDCAYKDGTYYFYFPHPSETDWHWSWKIGVATSKEPAANFTVQGYIEGMDPLIDPCVFVDDDGQAYIYNGGGGTCKGGRLKDNMMELDGAMQTMEGLVDFHEAAWIHKYNGKYYLTYASEWPEKIAYAVADHIEGPYETKGIISEIAGNSNTTHPAIVNFKGQWIFISHNGGLPTGTSYSRSIVAEPMEYNADGSIKPIPPTAEGVKPL